MVMNNYIMEQEEAVLGAPHNTRLLPKPHAALPSIYYLIPHLIHLNIHLQTYFSTYLPISLPAPVFSFD